MPPKKDEKCETCDGTGWVAYKGKRGNLARMICGDCKGHGIKPEEKK